MMAEMAMPAEKAAESTKLYYKTNNVSESGSPIPFFF